MNNFYKKLIGGYEIKKHKEQWELYQEGAIKGFFGFNGLIVLLILTLVASIFITEIKNFLLSLAGYIFIFLFLKFGEYKGYNECLYDMENE